MKRETVSDLGKYREAVASMWLGDEIIGHLYLSSQLWSLSSSDRPKVIGRVLGKRFGKGEHESRTEELFEWIVAWSTPAEGAEPYLDDVVVDVSSLLGELDRNEFTIGGKRYGLHWIEGPERVATMQDVFGIFLPKSD